MPGQSQNGDKFDVADSQHIFEPEIVRSIPDLLAALFSDLLAAGTPSKTRILSMADVQRTEVERALAGGSLSARCVNRLTSLLESAERREYYRTSFRHAADRRSASIRARFLESIAVNDILFETRSPQNEVRSLAFLLMEQAGVDPVLPRIADYPRLIESLVEKTRHRQGERSALRNAAVLLRLFRDRSALDSSDGRLTLLSLVFYCYDLAAPLNDSKILDILANILSSHQRYLKTDSERVITARSINDIRSLANRYNPAFHRSRARQKASVSLSNEALKDLSYGINEYEIASRWPRLFLSWAGAHVNLINATFAMGASQAEMLSLFERHDEITATIFARHPEIFPTGDAVMVGLANSVRLTSAGDPHVADLKAQFALVRPDPLRHVRPPQRGGKTDFNPDEAIAHTAAALNAVDPRDRYRDTVTAHLWLVQAEAILCKFSRDWTLDRRAEYRYSRENARTMLLPLGMARRLDRLASLERAAGFLD